MNDIRVPVGTPLTITNLFHWISQFESNEKQRRIRNYQFFTNTLEPKLKIPFCKELVLTSASVTVGDGCSFQAPVDLTDAQMATFDKILNLFEKQKIMSHDKKIVTEGCAISTAYELCYMSSDDEPVPKVTKIDSRSAFVVFDNTADKNELYGIWFERYKQASIDRIIVNCADSVNIYTFDYTYRQLQTATRNTPLPNGIPHHMGQVPLIKYWNNEEEQADFEQVLELILDRTTLHDLTLADTKKIVKNILALVNADLDADTKEEHGTKLEELNEVPVLPLNNPNPLKQPNAFMLSKNENYGMIDSFGRDLDSKIHKASLIPDLTSETFAGNVTGVALEFKLMPFKELISLKEENLKDLIKKRLKCFMFALTQPIIFNDGQSDIVINGKYEWFDSDDIIITVHRNWTKNINEIAQTIATLKSTELFSDKYLINQMPNADYEDEKDQKELETEEKSELNTNYIDTQNMYSEQMKDLVTKLDTGAEDGGNETVSA